MVGIITGFYAYDRRVRERIHRETPEVEAPLRTRPKLLPEQRHSRREERLAIPDLRHKGEGDEMRKASLGLAVIIGATCLMACGAAPLSAGGRGPDALPSWNDGEAKREILDGVWEYDFDGDPNIVEVYVRRLRRALDEPYDRHAIQTVRGSGYRLDPDGG